jgi:YidC/Oxa1 family membrane protein insertase
MGGILSAIGLLFGKLMYFIYNTIGFHNYALSLVFFTIAYKLILLPLSIKQMRSTQLMQELQPELQRIQERYKNDREKLQEEQLKFYQEKGYNPTSGCLPLLIQMPIILALFYVIRMPMSYMLDIPARAVSHMAIISIQNGDLPSIKSNIEIKDPSKEELDDKYLQELYGEITKKDAYVEIKILDIISRKPELVSENPYLTDDFKQVLIDFDLRMFKIFNLGVKPELNIKKMIESPGTYIPPLIILLIAVGTTFLYSAQMLPQQQQQQKGKDKKQANSGCAGKSMMLMSPIMTLWIGLSTPCGLSVYWTLNNILTYVQQKIMNKYFKKDDNAQKEGNKVAKVNNKRG